jgi:hypothetical protein
LGSNPDFLALMKRFRDWERGKGGVPLPEVRQRLGIPKGISGKLDELLEEADA